jgi:arsenite methyltransferase
MLKADLRRHVREGYAAVVNRSKSSCRCGSAATEDYKKKIGYTDADISAVPAGANLGLGCGNPVAMASLRSGETVLDLGSGAGVDCFLAAMKVGRKGRVIGVDMTPEMVETARENAKKGRYRNVEFRLGEIENLPAADNSVDAVISNCVINLSPDKRRVFAEAFRVLRPGGRVMISDIVLLRPLPRGIRQSIAAYVGCFSGALLKRSYVSIVKKVGFREVMIAKETPFPLECMASDPTAQTILENMKLSLVELRSLAARVVSVSLHATRPA